MGVVFAAIGALNTLIRRKTKCTRSPLSPMMDALLPIGYFDGASKDSIARSRVGMVIKLSVNHIVRMWMGPGRSTNTRGPAYSYGTQGCI